MQKRANSFFLLSAGMCWIISGLINPAPALSDPLFLRDHFPDKTQNSLSFEKVDQLNAELFLLALGQKGLAGGNTGICVDYVAGDQPQFRIAVDTDKAFETGQSDLQTLNGGFKSDNLKKMLSYLQEFRRKTTLNQKSDLLHLNIQGYADAQHDDKAKTNGLFNLDMSIESNRKLAFDRANAIQANLLSDPALATVIHSTPSGYPSTTLEKKYPKPNASYERNGQNKLACDTRRKVLIVADVDASGGAEDSSGKYMPQHLLASSGLRSDVAFTLNKKFRDAFEKVNSSLPREARAAAAAQSIVNSEPAIADMCKKEPYVSLIAEQILAVETNKERKKGDVFLKGDNLPVEGVGGIVDDNGIYQTLPDASINDYDVHRNLVALRAAVRFRFNKINGHAPSDSEMQILLNDPNEMNSIDQIFKTSNKKRPTNPDFLQAVGKEVTSVTGGQGQSNKGTVWSMGGGTAAFQCFSVKSALLDYLKTAKGRSESMKSGAEIAHDHVNTGAVEIGFDPKKLSPIQPASGTFSLLGTSKPIYGYVCKYCGMGLQFDPQTGKADFFDRSLGPKGTSLIGNLRTYSKDVGNAFTWGSLMVPMTYVIPNCRNCECEDMMDKIQNCGQATSQDGVDTCANGVTRLNPLEQANSHVAYSVDKAKLADECIFTPSSFHTCGQGPQGGSDEAQEKTQPNFTYFDSVRMQYSATEAKDKLELENKLLSQWQRQCADSALLPKLGTPGEIINDVTCKASPKGSFPTGVDKIDCPNI